MGLKGTGYICLLKTEEEKSRLFLRARVHFYYVTYMMRGKREREREKVPHSPQLVGRHKRIQHFSPQEIYIPHFFPCRFYDITLRNFGFWHQTDKILFTINYLSKSHARLFLHQAAEPMLESLFLFRIHDSSVA